MNNYCIYMKKRKNKPFCCLQQNEISFSCCKECDNKKYKKRKNVKIHPLENKNFVKNSTFYKSNNNQIRKNAKLQEKKSTLKKKSPLKSGMQQCNQYYSKTHNNKKMRVKSNKLAKLERKRYSVFTSDDKCFVCKSTNLLTWNEIFRGRNRANSMKYGFCLRMCLFCHEEKQEDADFNDYWHRQAQLYFEEHIGSREEFISIFRKNYLD